MEPLAISWLVTSSSSPLIAVLALWTIYVFHTYRRRWRTVDLFLLTICCQELVISIFTFCYAIISLIIPPFLAPCNFTQWGLISCRTFQIATLTSMVVDRALTVRWPYRYRFSVRRNQIRYHIGVLSLVSILVGVAAVFAKVDIVNNKNCYLHPRQWDVRYVVFLLSLYGVLVVVTFICMIQVEIYRSRHGLKTNANGSFQLPECASPDLPSATGMTSPLDTQSSTGSTRALHRPSRQASRRPYGKNNKSTSDLRWPSVALTTLLCFSLNHIPHLVLMSMAAYYPYLWSPWHEAIITWMGLLEGVIIPLILFCKDHALRTGLRRAFQRRSGALSPLVGDDGPFQMYFDKDHFRKRGTFGSVTPIGIITNYRRTPGKKRRTRKNSGKYTLPGLHNGDSVLAKSCLSAGYLGNEPLSKLSCADLTSLEMWREEDEENFYATLSDDFSTFSCKSADDSALSEDLRISEELYGGSFTTVANDDFEFHDTRPCGGEVRMKPALSATPPSNNSFKGGFSRNVSFKDDIRKKELSKLCQEPLQNLFNYSDSYGTEEDRKDPEVFILPPPEWKYKEQTDLLGPTDLELTPPKKVSNKIGNYQKNTSYSMNDLDLIHKKTNGGNAGETTFVLPVKSESTMSLYRLNVERDLDQMAMTPSRSETNVNGDSGFGSGAQSTNPVWSGFLCRKPSDPFWNIRKPATHATAAVTPTKKYPGLMHPRMRKIPWITAWKKLDENSNRNERNQMKESQQNNSVLDWKDNMVYEANQSGDGSKNIVGTIDEELSDVSSPVFNSDYNLNIFAKQSGVLLENAYGKIVRDDCGVQVNFYGKSVQYDGKDVLNGNFNPSDNLLFGENFNCESPMYEKNEEQVIGHCSDKDLFRNLSHELVDCNVLQTAPQAQDTAKNQFKYESGLNGGHYENLFGTKENIFAQCDQYIDKNKYNPAPIKIAVKNLDDNIQFKNKDNAFSSRNTEPTYGQVKIIERKESGSRKSSDKRPQIRNQEVPRRESDIRNNKNVLKRRESRSRSDSRTKNEKSNQTTLNLLDTKSDARKSVTDEKVEIEMRNVPLRKELNYDYRFNKVSVNPASPCNFNRQGSQSRKPIRNFNDPKRCRLEQSNIKKHNSDSTQQQKDPNAKLARRESLRAGKNVEDLCVQQSNHNQQSQSIPTPSDIPCKSKSSYSNIDRRESIKKIPQPRDAVGQIYTGIPNGDNLEKNPCNRSDNLRSRICRRDSYSKRKETKNEGLWANAVPFEPQTVNCDRDEENGNLPKKEIRIESHHPLRRSPRKSNLPRRESKNKNEKPNAHVRRRSSGNKRKSDKFDSQEKSDVLLGKKNLSSISKNELEEKKALLQQGDAKCDSNFDDFFKYRDRCEDNFSRIQNLNRETSADRESTKVDQYRRKMNGNISSSAESYSFETFQENGKLQFYPNSKTEFDDNENCQQKKLAITDFL